MTADGTASSIIISGANGLMATRIAIKLATDIIELIIENRAEIVATGRALASRLAFSIFS